MRSHEQLEDKIQFILSTYIQRKLNTTNLITITAVKLTSDHSIAKIYFTTLGDTKKLKISYNTLIKNSTLLRKHLAKSIRIHRVPILHFTVDDSLENSNKLESIFKAIEKERINHKDIL